MNVHETMGGKTGQSGPF